VGAGGAGLSRPLSAARTCERHSCPPDASAPLLARFAPMFVPGSNLLLLGGLFVVGWFSGHIGFNRNEPEYLASAVERVAAKEAAIASAPPEAVAEELAAAKAAELATSSEKED